MRSTSSPRAVSSSTGNLETARILRSTSNPLIPGSMTSSTASTYSPAVAFSKPLSPSCTDSVTKPSARKYSPTRWQSSTSSSITRIRSIAVTFCLMSRTHRSKELSNLVQTLLPVTSFKKSGFSKKEKKHRSFPALSLRTCESSRFPTSVPPPLRYKTLLCVTDSLPQFASPPCSHLCTQRPGPAGHRGICMKSFRFRLFAAALAVLMGAAIAKSQTADAPPVRAMHAPGFGIGGHMEFLAKKLNLSDEQKSQMKAIVEKERPAVQPLIERQHQLDLELRQYAEGSFDEAKVQV